MRQVSLALMVATFLSLFVLPSADLMAAKKKFKKKKHECPCRLNK